MKSGPIRDGARQAMAAAVFLAAAAAAGVIFLKVFAPKPHPKRLPPYEDFDRRPMQDALSPEHVREELDALLAMGSRFPGQDGCRRTADYIRQRFHEAGLTVLEYPQKLAVPRTLERVIADGAGKPLEDVDIYPFWPNHVQPIVTPPAGTTGILLLVNRDVLLTRPRFDDCIAVIDVMESPRGYYFDWVKYAQLGFKAVIVAHRDGLQEMRWNSVQSMRSSAPVNYPRLVATEGIYRHLGETVTLRVRTIWDEVELPTLVGVLAGEKPAAEAVVLTSCYDACSTLPDMAPGTLGACGVAAQLAILDGIGAYRATPLKRDLVFVSYASQVMGQLAADRLTTVLGPALNREEGRVILEQRKDVNEASRRRARGALACFEKAGFFTDASATAAVLEALDAGTAEFIETEFRYVLNTLVLELSESQLQARLAFLRAGEDNLAGPEFAAYRAAKRRFDRVMAVAGYRPAKLLQSESRLASEWAIRDRLRQRVSDLRAFYEWRGGQIDAELAIHRTLGRYRRLVAVGSYLVPTDPATTRGEAFSYFMGAGAEFQGASDSTHINDLVFSLVQRMALPETVRYDGRRTQGHDYWAGSQMADLPVDAEQWSAKGYPAFVMVNTDRRQSYESFGSPVEKPFMRDLSTVANGLQVMGRTVLALAYGEGVFDEPNKRFILSANGRVYMANVGRSIVPNYPLAHALIAHKGTADAFAQPGHQRYAFYFADPEGRYDLPLCTAAIAPSVPPGYFYSPEAVGFGPDGRIRCMKDEGPQGQSVYRSVNLHPYDRSDVNIVVFRATPVSIFDLINPQTLKMYSGVTLISREGLTPLPKINSFDQVGGLVTMFVEPDRRFYVTLRAGSPDNEIVQTTRAVMLGFDEQYRAQTGGEIDGPGFLAADSDSILQVPLHVTRSMLSVNGKRLALQMKYNLADERTQSFHRRSEELLRRSLTPRIAQHTAVLEQRDAATYATLNHPVLRQTISEAVVGILWYLGLLVPFVFFFEKLLFGFADIRKQIAAQTVIFLVVFMLLRILHPAFQMIRSSLMILLGFVIMLISGGITILFSGKFRENLESLKKRRGQVSAAEADTMGVTATGFTLGLNNMHRRIVRTGLTCATLVLITFAMICFTSVQSNLVNESAAIGKAAYQGLLIKGEKMAPISWAELFGLQTKYGHEFVVTPRRAVVGTLGWDRIQYNPLYEIVYEPTNAAPKRLPFASVMTFSVQEPLRDRIRLLTAGGWFTEEMLKAAGEIPPVMISEVLADSLGIRPAEVDAGEVRAKINGYVVSIHGIFSAPSLGALRDLDGRDLLPFDIEAIRNVQLLGGEVLAEDTDPRMNPEQIVLAADGFPVGAQRGMWRQLSIAVVMPELGYKEARAEVDQYMEQSGERCHFGLDGVAYSGKRARERTMSGTLELLIPLVIAALAVLNTMRGSVYERRDEIFVYNAVGIAPRYIFAIFFSEAFVFAVVGSVMGYILSQGVGRILYVMNWTGGLNMTFTSVVTIHASLAIMGAVFLSTFFPARSAMEIAAPAEDSGWDLPDPVGDEMSFALPFTFDAEARVAVLSFFHRYFLDHGEGSAGRFFAGPPQVGISDRTDPLAENLPVPELAVTIWLKPFDLGVSQRLTIALPTDPETGEFIAWITLTRLSGTRESWLRLNYGFVGLLRRNFLYWRAVSPSDRRVMFEEAGRLLQEGGAAGEALHG